MVVSLVFLFFIQLNIANPSTGCMKVIEVDDEKQLYVGAPCLSACTLVLYWAAAVSLTPPPLTQACLL